MNDYYVDSVEEVSFWSWCVKMLKVYLTQFFSLAKVKLWNTHKKNLPNFSVSDTFKGLKN